MPVFLASLFFPCNFSYTNCRYQAEKNKADYPFEAEWIHYLERLVQDLDRKYVSSNHKNCQIFIDFTLELRKHMIGLIHKIHWYVHYPSQSSSLSLLLLSSCGNCQM